MNQRRFEIWTHAIQDDFLEEAQTPVRHRSMHIRIAAGAAAACLCLIIGGVMWYHTGRGGLLPEQDRTQLSSPMQSVTKAELTQLGYTLPLPSGAQNAAYSTISPDEGSSVPMAQVTFLQNGQTYTYRALQTEAVQDISGIYSDWTETLDWQADTLAMQLRKSSDDSAAWVGWYSPSEQTQWCLSGTGENALTLLHTAQEIVDALGYNITAAPEGAEDILYSAFSMDGLTVAETTFLLNGVHYIYRMAETSDVSPDFSDISGDASVYDSHAESEVLWCPARIDYTESGGGKIIWFDVVPGLLYSLVMESGASADALLKMAETVFTPAQEILD